ncbi:MAG TPA: hypothetical protein VFC51_11515 [Chloroflexota bacterium]|nr:hypothetical protein [Chloroflexota bacterium]
MLDPSNVFLIIFMVSMGLTFASFALGIGHLPGFHAGDGGVEAAPGGAGHLDFGHGHFHLDAGGVSPLNMATILAFLTWFGGAGYVLSSTFAFEGWAAAVLAGLTGLVGAGIVFVVLVRVLIPGQTPYLSADDFDLEGTIGRLTVAIRPGGTGELVFSLGGTRHAIGARSISGDAIERGAEVVVVREEHGIAFVQKFEEMLTERLGHARAP